MYNIIYFQTFHLCQSFDVTVGKLEDANSVTSTYKGTAGLIILIVENWENFDINIIQTLIERHNIYHPYNSVNRKYISHIISLYPRKLQ